jgi:hypothetical protein
VHVVARTLPAVLVVSAAFADTRRAHELAFYLLLAAVPAAGAAALAHFGALVDAPEGSEHERHARADVTTSAFALILIVIACAVRSPARLEAGVPVAGVSVVVVCLCVYGVQAVLALSRLKMDKLVTASRSRA